MKTRNWISLGWVATFAVFAGQVMADWYDESAAVAQYQQQTAVRKLEQLWGVVKSDPYRGEYPTKGPSPVEAFNSLNRLVRDRFLRLTFRHTSDFFPRGRTKLVHPLGSTAKVRLEIAPDSPYTGILKSGGVGIIRLSIATPHDRLNPFTPGFAMKILVDGQPSANFFAMPSLDGQGNDTRFFAHDFSTSIAPATNLAPKLLRKVFDGFLDRAADTMLAGAPPVASHTIALDDVSSVTSKGELVSPRIPHSLVFTPTMQARAYDSPVTIAEDFRKRLETIPAGSTLFEVRVREHEHAALSPAIGVVRLTEKFITSEAQDKRLFFQHPLRLERGNMPQSVDD